MKKMIFLLYIMIMGFGCAKPADSTNNPNLFYYYAYAKYSLNLNDYINWNGLFFYPNTNQFSLNYQNPTDFSCIGYATYSTTTSDFFPTNDGDELTISGTLLEPTGACFGSMVSFTIKKLGLLNNTPYYEMTLGTEKYQIKTSN